MSRADRAWTAAALALVAVAIGFRVWALGRLPGINGDEAWYGVQAARLVAGEGLARTPSGNWPGPLHLGTLAAFQAVLPRSFALLRVPSVLASLAAMALAWSIGRRLMDRRAALALLVLAAALPVDIAYARFGWDPSWNVAVGLAAARFALAADPVATALLFLLALAVHPTNLFAAPFLLCAFAGAAWGRAGRGAAIRRTVPLAIAMLAAAALVVASTSGGRAAASPGLAARIVDPADWVGFALLYGRMLSGDTVYRYVAGAGFGPFAPAVDAAMLFVLGALLLFGGRALARQGSPTRWGIVAGWLASLAAFHVVAGNGAISPHFDRYALCLVAPGLLAIATLAHAILGERLLPVACAAAAVLLAGFAVCYLGALERTGSTSHPAFWTGAAEPKRAAFARILADAAPRGAARVIAEDYWLRLPLAYLAIGTPIAVTAADEPAGPPLRGGTYRVAFGGSGWDRAIAASGGASPVATVRGTGRPAAVKLWWTPPAW